jgi:hypothetical protein
MTNKLFASVAAIVLGTVALQGHLLSLCKANCVSHR